MLEMEEIFIVMSDVCTSYKHTLQHQTDQGVNPGCAECRQQDLESLAQMLNTGFLFYKTEITHVPQGHCQLDEDVYVIHLQQDLAHNKCSKYDSWSQSSPHIFR